MTKQLVEVCRSFSFKLNVGNFESRDFFCSQKAEVPEDEVEETSRKLHHFCKMEVIKSVNQYLKEQKELTEPKPVMPTGRIPEQKLQNELEMLEEIQEKK